MGVQCRVPVKSKKTHGNSKKNLSTGGGKGKHALEFPKTLKDLLKVSKKTKTGCSGSANQNQPRSDDRPLAVNYFRGLGVGGVGGGCWWCGGGGSRKTQGDPMPKNRRHILTKTVPWGPFSKNLGTVWGPEIRIKGYYRGTHVGLEGGKSVGIKPRATSKGTEKKDAQARWATEKNPI